jgi:1-phosphofructokinase family hexose kinase
MDTTAHAAEGNGHETRGIIATVTANPSIDQHILIDRLVKDDAIRAREIRRDPGGKGINVSRVLKELGGETAAFAITGGGAGYILKNLLRERGIPLESVEVLEETRINFIFTDRSDRTQTRISAPGPWVPLESAHELIAKALRHRPAPRWWVLGGSLPRGIPTDFYARIVRPLRTVGAECFLDADDDALKIGIEAQPYAIKPNESELARLVGRRLRDESAFLDAAREVVRTGVELVALTLGDKGALLVTRDTAVRSLAPRVEVRSKVGAGDSFLAGLVLGLSRGDSLAEAARLATAAGTAAVIHEGTQLCRSEDVARMLPLVSVETVTLVSPPQNVASPPAPARDVVCGMEVDPALVEFCTVQDDRRFRFCSLACQKQFEQSPERYLTRVGGESWNAAC